MFAAIKIVKEKEYSQFHDVATILWATVEFTLHTAAPKNAVSILAMILQTDQVEA